VSCIYLAKVGWGVGVAVAMSSPTYWCGSNKLYLLHTIFWPFPTNFRRFSKWLVWRLHELGRTFRKITKDYRRLPKITKAYGRLSWKTWICFDHTPTYLGAISEINLISGKSSKSQLARKWQTLVKVAQCALVKCIAFWYTYKVINSRYKAQIIRPIAEFSHIVLRRKLNSGTFKLVPVRPDSPLFWKSRWVTCVLAYLIQYHVTGSCKGPIRTRPSHIFFVNPVYGAARKTGRLREVVAAGR